MKLYYIQSLNKNILIKKEKQYFKTFFLKMKKIQVIEFELKKYKI